MTPYKKLLAITLCTLSLTACKKQTTRITTHRVVTYSVPNVSTPIPQACENSVLNKQSPMLPKEISPKSMIICYKNYAVITSGISHTGLLAMEYRDRDLVERAEKTPRVNRFHEDEHEPQGWSAEPKDYTRSGYDKGHLAPSGDMPDAESQYESFSMANMAPQVPHLNRGLWANIEAAVKNTAKEHPLYIVTGTSYTSPPGQQLQISPHKVFVPTYYWKAVLSKDGEISGVYAAANDGTGIWRELSFKQCEDWMHAIPFPNLPVELQNRPPSLPTPINIHMEDKGE